MAQAQRPPSSTAAGAQERAAAADEDAAEFVNNLFIVDEDTADASEVSTLPQLQRLLENMDAQAGRVVANETYCMVEEGGFAALDDVGRERLLNVCRKFHAQCQRTAPEEEARQLLWRVQQIVNGRSHQEDEAEPEGGGHRRLSFGHVDKLDPVAPGFAFAQRQGRRRRQGDLADGARGGGQEPLVHAVERVGFGEIALVPAWTRRP